VGLSAAAVNPVTEAMAVGTGVAAGALQATGEIVAATADMANTAAQTVAAVTTGVAPEDTGGSASRQQAETPRVRR
jgi:hypothetical protein